VTTTHGVIDADIHPTAIDTLNVLMPYLSESWRRQLEPRADLPLWPSLPGRAPRFTDSLLRKDATPPSGGEPGSDPAFVSEDHMDRHGIEIGLLIALEAGAVNTWTNPDEAAAIASAANEFLADKWLPADDRFRLAMVVSPLDAQLAAAEIRRFGDTPHVAAIWLPLIAKLLGHRDFFPIYEAAEEAGLPIVLHPDGTGGNYIGCPEFAVATPPTNLEQRCLLSEFGMSNLANLLFEGTFERFPGLKVVFAEYGWDWVAPLLWRIDATWKMGRRAVPWVKRPPSEYVLDHIRFTSEPAIEAPTDREAVQMLEMMQAERTLLFSSDYPHYDADDPAMIFRSATPELRQRILRDNAVETFGPRLQLAQPVA
jgi:predicted TIM-barrel fold metal-dependent hydrolase